MLESLLDRLRPIGAPTESAITALGAGERILSEVLSPTRITGKGSTEPGRLADPEVATRVAKALRRQMLCELMKRDTDLLGGGSVNGEVLRELSEKRDHMLGLGRILRSGGAGERVEKRVRPRALPQEVLRVRARCKRSLGELTLHEGILLERVRLCAGGIRLALAGLCGIKPIGAVCAGLAKQAGTHLRRPRSRGSGELRHETLREIL
jgi:hypothetical protein